MHRGPRGGTTEAPQISYATHPSFAGAVLASKTEWSGWGSSTCPWWLVVCLAVDACKDVTVVKEGSSVRAVKVEVDLWAGFLPRFCGKNFNSFRGRF